MANETKITEIVGREAYEQLEKLTALLETTKNKYIEAAKEMAKLTTVKPTNYEELDAKMKSYDETSRKLVATQNELARLSREQITVINRLSSALPPLTKSIEAFLNHTKEATNALGANTKAANENATAAQNNAQSSREAASGMETASEAINLSAKAYNDIIKSISAYNSNLESTNKSLVDNKVRITEIRNNLKDLDDQYKRHIINEKEYKNAVAALLSEERLLMEQGKQYVSLLRTHAQVAVSTTGSYYEMNAAVLALEKQYKSLSQTQRESPLGTGMVKQIDDLKGKLKTIDASLGNYQRNVGNYASSWNGLQYQFQMISRELPNLGINLQTFIISLSNNIPYLVDELQKASVAHKQYVAAVKAGNKDLKAVPSVFKQAIGAIFNWQTAIIVAITLITAYREEIQNWIGSLFGAEKAVKKLLNAQQIMALARHKGISDTAKERTELKILYGTVKDVTRAEGEREAALRQLAKMHPETFANTTKESIANGKLERSYQLLIKAIKDKAIAEKYSDMVAEESLKKDEAITKLNNQKATVTNAQKEYEARKKLYELNKKEAEEEKKGVDPRAQAIINNNLALEEAALDRAKRSVAEQQKIYDDLEKEVETHDKNITDISNHISTLNLFPEPKKGSFDYWQQQLTDAQNALKQFDADTKDILDKASKDNKNLYDLGIDKETVDAYKKNISDINEAKEKLKIYDDPEKQAIENTNTEKEQEKHLKYLQKLQIEINSATAKAMDEQRESELAEVEAWYQKRLSVIKQGGKKTQEEIEKENELRVVLEQAKAKKIKDINERFSNEVEKADIENRLASIRVTNEIELEEKKNLLLRQNEILRMEEVNEAKKTKKDEEAIHEKYNQSFKKILEDTAQERINIINKRGEDERSTEEINHLKEENELKERYKNGETTEKDYQLWLLKIKEKYAKLSVEIALKYAELELEAARSNMTDEEIKKIEKKIQKLREQLHSLSLSPDKEESDKIREWAEGFSDAFANMGDAARNSLGEVSSVFGAANTIISDFAKYVHDNAEQGKKTFADFWGDLDPSQKAAYILQGFADLFNGITALRKQMLESQIESIEEEQEANKEAGEKEIERIEELADSGAISEEEAEARKRDAKKKTEEKDKQLEKEKMELKQKEARWDKANAIVQTAIATGLAIMKAAPNMALMIAIAAMGTAQAAMIAARSIPKYAKGTDNHPGGLAVVGDGGKREAVLFDGSMFITPSIPTLIELPKGATVLPEIPRVDDMDYLARVYRSDLRMAELDNQMNGRPDIINNVVYLDGLDKKMDTLISSNNASAKEFKKLCREIAKNNYIKARGL